MYWLWSLNHIDKPTHSEMEKQCRYYLDGMGQILQQKGDNLLGEYMLVAYQLSMEVRMCRCSPLPFYPPILPFSQPRVSCHCMTSSFAYETHDVAEHKLLLSMFRQPKPRTSVTHTHSLIYIQHPSQFTIRVFLVSI